MKLLLTNDDGYRAPGILALYHELTNAHEVVLVAPDRERSAIGHGITLNTPLSMEKVCLNGGGSGYAVTGTPADCVKLALFELCKEKPDLVISGINAGSNTGININYSGTAGAAREAALNGLAAMAVSIQYGEVMDFKGMAAYIAGLAKNPASLDLPSGSFLNINAPCIAMDQVRGVRMTRQAGNNLAQAFETRVDPRNRTYFWYGRMTPVAPQPDTDDHALSEQCISISPIQSDMTDYSALAALSTAGFEQN